jgi:hypothetical protein
MSFDLVQRIGGQRRAQPAQQDALPQPRADLSTRARSTEDITVWGHDRPGENLSGTGACAPHARQGRTLFDSHRGQPHDQRFQGAHVHHAPLAGACAAAPAALTVARQAVA